MSTDLGKLLRRRKPNKKIKQLVARPVDKLLAASSLSSSRMPILLDTNVYINNLAGRIPKDICDIIDNSILYHCSVCLSEITTGIGNFNPNSSDWNDVVKNYTAIFDSIPTGRILEPSAEIWLDAGMIAGIISRTQGYQAHQRKEILNDALIFLTAARHGIPVLTSNRIDFDLIQQLVPNGLFAYYVVV